MRSLKRQTGLSFFFWLFFIAILAFLGVVGIRLTPIYLEYYTVSNLLESVAAESGIAKESKRQVWSKIQKRLDVNSVSHVQYEDFSMDVGDKQVTYTIKYEVRTELLGNVDAVVKFEKSVPANAH